MTKFGVFFPARQHRGFKINPSWFDRSADSQQVHQTYYINLLSVTVVFHKSPIFRGSKEIEQFAVKQFHHQLPASLPVIPGHVEQLKEMELIPSVATCIRLFGVTPSVTSDTSEGRQKSAVK